MSRGEFEEFYKYITACDHEAEDIAVKEKLWENLKETEIEEAMSNAMNIYKIAEYPLTCVNPKVFKGEIPNPWLFGKTDIGGSIPC